MYKDQRFEVNYFTIDIIKNQLHNTGFKNPTAGKNPERVRRRVGVVSWFKLSSFADGYFLATLSRRNLLIIDLFSARY